jgi:signal recognition particle GTPase
MRFSLILVLLIHLYPSSPLSSVYSFRLLAPMKSQIVPQHTIRNRKLYMVFDFFKKRSEEGFQQIQNIATKTLDGKLLEALQDSSDYIKMRQKADMESFKKLTDGLARSRDKLLGGINGVFSDENLDVKNQLEKLEEVLLQSDIGVATTSQIISDLAAYARTQGLEQSMILPVLRSRLIESLTKAEEPSTDVCIPRVIFVIGANGTCIQ